MATPTPAASLKRFIGKFSAPVQRVAVAALAKPGIAVHVDPPVEHILADEARRRRAQQLDDPARRLGIGVGGDVPDGELHQANRNCAAIASPIALLSRI